ncbi:hypothetical protein [Gilliamella sp. Pas-s25]|uniref:hypothetical protein n=1 Tax=Gilliamella sp. Pas-s25 TaxID=2687310 RepID=UPI00135DA870|nr:hypothetical protein [Gilliamella sp. Pas-s25]MWP63215.1 hypothetical protein [Gilliamella sp. Pas-s25]
MEQTTQIYMAGVMAQIITKEYDLIPSVLNRWIINQKRLFKAKNNLNVVEMNRHS